MNCHAAGLEQFRSTPDSQHIRNGRGLAAEVKAVLVAIQFGVKVWASSGAVRMAAKAQAWQMEHSEGR
jgi:hypothetical protein